MAKVKKWTLCLKNIATDNGLEFDFAIISANKFKSGFLKEDLEKICIFFPNLNLKPYIKNVSTILTSQKTRDSFFYLFYRSKDDKEISINKITKSLTVELFK